MLTGQSPGSLISDENHHIEMANPQLLQVLPWAPLIQSDPPHSCVAGERFAGLLNRGVTPVNSCESRKPLIQYLNRPNIALPVGRNGPLLQNKFRTLGAGMCRQSTGSRIPVDRLLISAGHLRWEAGRANAWQILGWCAGWVCGWVSSRGVAMLGICGTQPATAVFGNRSQEVLHSCCFLVIRTCLWL